MSHPFPQVMVSGSPAHLVTIPALTSANQGVQPVGAAHANVARSQPTGENMEERQLLAVMAAIVFAGADDSERAAGRNPEQAVGVALQILASVDIALCHPLREPRINT